MAGTISTTRLLSVRLTLTSLSHLLSTPVNEMCKSPSCCGVTFATTPVTATHGFFTASLPGEYTPNSGSPLRQYLRSSGGANGATAFSVVRSTRVDSDALAGALGTGDSFRDRPLREASNISARTAAIGTTAARKRLGRRFRR